MNPGIHAKLKRPYNLSRTGLVNLKRNSNYLKIPLLLLLLSLQTLFFASSLYAAPKSDRKGGWKGDLTKPIPGNNGIIKIVSSSSTSIQIAWSPATDSFSKLSYMIIVSNKDNISSTEEALTNGEVYASGLQSVQTYSIRGLVSGTSYWFNIIVKDRAGNSAAYSSVSAMTDEAPPQEPEPFCGDRNIDSELGEKCDDGNAIAGDGCDQNCQIEPQEPEPFCGDKNIDSELGEECDDGNAIAGDGCDQNCQIEPQEPESFCGDKNIDSELGEECDDGNTIAGDGCDQNCQLEPQEPEPFCGDKNIDSELGEECDDGNTIAGDGCDQNCRTEPQPPTCSGTDCERECTNSYSLGSKKILIVKVNDSRYRERFTWEKNGSEIDPQIASFFKSYDTYLQFASYGQVSIAGYDIYPEILTADGTGKSSMTLVRELLEELHTAHPNICSHADNQYNKDCKASYDICIFSWWSTGGVSGGPWLMIGTEGWNERAPAHELGHTFGMGHSNSIEVSNQKRYIYGNKFDIMGSGQYPWRDYGTFHKENVDWLADSQLINVN